MRETEQSNQIINLSGSAVTEPEFSHEIGGEKFYTFLLKCDRLSEASDTLPVTISDRLLPEVANLVVGEIIAISGEIRTRNLYDEKTDRRHLDITVFAKDVIVTDEDTNEVHMHGFICKKPTYRQTPNGRYITDILVAVNRKYGKSDYIPCICWGRNARFAESLDVGQEIDVKGRLQSRTYQKKTDDKVVEKVAYELSISSISKCN